MGNIVLVASRRAREDTDWVAPGGATADALTSFNICSHRKEGRFVSEIWISCQPSGYYFGTVVVGLAFGKLVCI